MAAFVAPQPPETEVQRRGGKVAVPRLARHTITLDDGHHLTLLCEDEGGYRNLCRLITEAHAGTRPDRTRPPLPPVTTYSALGHHAEGLVCLSGCARHGALARAVEELSLIHI